jgi:hypothetical protein
MLRDLPFQTIGDVARHGLDLHAELLQVGGPVTLAFLWCNSCLWEIDHVQLDKPPWSGTARRYPCPGCGGRVEWHIHVRRSVGVVAQRSNAVVRRSRLSD